MAEPRRILVVKSRHLGDVLLTGPLCSALKRRWPQAKLTVLVKPGTEAMLQGHPDVDEVLCFPESAGGLMRQARFLWALRRRGFDLALNTTEGDRGLIALLASDAAVRAGIVSPYRRTPLTRVLTHPLRPRPGRLHTVQRHLELLQALPGGADAAARAPAVHVQLRYTRADADVARQVLEPLGRRPVAVVHAVSRWAFKMLPAVTMAAAVDRLHALGAQVLLTAGPCPAETQRVREIAARCAHPPHDLAGRLSLKQLAAVLARARLFVGVDSAPMHMAAALDVPVVAVFGPSGAFDWGPWPNGYDGPFSPYPATRGLQRAGPHWVLQDDRDCVPCGKAGCHDSRRSACLEEWPAARLVQAVTEAWQQAGGR